MKKVILLFIVPLAILMADFTLMGTQLTPTDAPVAEPTPAPTPTPAPEVPSNGDYTVVPGLYGFGTDTRAAYGGSKDPVILHVNTLAKGVSNTDSTHGSFEWAITRDYPRVVVFDVSGVIDADHTLQVKNPYITIAGQTAPAHIVLHGEGLKFWTHDVLIQHFASRNKGAYNKDNFGVTGYDGPNYNVVFDHLSASWSTDEAIEAWNSSTNKSLLHHVTISNCIMAEGILDHSTGTLIQADNVSIIGNLWAHNKNRHPANGSPSRVAIYNNLTYNHRYELLQMNGQDDWNSDMYASYIGNHSVLGPNSKEKGHDQNLPVAIKTYASGDYVELFMRDNIKDTDVHVSGFDVRDERGIGYKVGTEIIIPNFTPAAASTTYNSVLSKAGARPGNRDKVDARIINEVKTRTGSHKSSTPSMPSYPVIKQEFVPVANPHDMYNKHYTNLEHQLHEMAAAVE